MADPLEPGGRGDVTAGVELEAPALEAEPKKRALASLFLTVKKG